MWSRQSSKYTEVDGEIFLGVLTDRLDQVPCLHQKLISIVVDRGVLEQLAGAAFACFKPVSNNGELFNGVMQLAGKLFVLKQLAGGAIARVEIVDQLVGLGEGLVRIVIEAVIFHQLAQITVASVDLIH